MTAACAASKACAVNPLKLSPALGAAMAFLGVERALPLLHGSQGCTAFALVLMVRHFQEAIPLQTTAMSELSTILGGADNVEQAIETIFDRAAPRLIGICSTALTETRGEDVAGDLASIRHRHPEWRDLAVVSAATPDWAGSLEDGWGAAVKALVEALVPVGGEPGRLRQVNLLAGAHMSPADVEATREMIAGFGLNAVVLPDLSQSLDGHVPDEYSGVSLGGTLIGDIRTMGSSLLTLAIGSHMQPAAIALHKRTGVPFRLFDTLSGLEAADAFVASLIELTQLMPPPAVQRARSRLIDAMLDAHFYFDGCRVGIAGEADLVQGIAGVISGLGARIEPAVVASTHGRAAGDASFRTVTGDLDDFAAAAAGCRLLIANSHAATLAGELDIPLLRAGFPVFDRIGAPQRQWVGYDGTRALIFEVANLLLEHGRHGHGHSSSPGIGRQQELSHAEAYSD